LEVGIVVVEVKVNRDGIVTYANIAKGTTNNAECLTAKAIQAAKKTKWQPKADAPLTQKGKIIYDFRVQ
jgi:TonB family protein